MNQRPRVIVVISDTPRLKVLELRARLDKALELQSIHGYSTNLRPRTKKVYSLSILFKYKDDSKLPIIRQELAQYGEVL